MDSTGDAMAGVRGCGDAGGVVLTEGGEVAAGGSSVLVHADTTSVASANVAAVVRGMRRTPCEPGEREETMRTQNTLRDGWPALAYFLTPFVSCGNSDVFMFLSCSTTSKSECFAVYMAVSA